jgi:ribosomal protein S18 acetylase RimI-like enzyme
MTEAVLVRATDADVPAIVALMNLAYRGGDPNGWNSESYIAGPRTSEALLREEIAGHPEGFQLVWRQGDGQLQGTVWLAPKGDGIWYLGSLTVDPAVQNSGLGRTLLAAAEDWVRAQGGTAIRMTVIHIRAGLLAWYQRRGYILTDETEPFPYDDDRFGMPQRDDLHFVVLTKPLR